MVRYLRLYGYFLRFSFSRAMEFRFDFFLRIGMDVMWYVMHFVFFEILYLHVLELLCWGRLLNLGAFELIFCKQACPLHYAIFE